VIDEVDEDLGVLVGLEDGAGAGVDTLEDVKEVLLVDGFA